MGDFCVSGFHSHLPIQEGDKAIAIICKHNNKALSNCPCYLQGVLTPICMPVVGYMGDYGSFEECEYDENETTRLLKEVTGEHFWVISERLAEMSNFRTDVKDYPEFFKKFNEFSKSDDGTRYHMIYEHYDVYKAMTFEWKYVRDAIDSFIVPMKKILTDSGYVNIVVSPFDDLLQCGLYSGMMDSIGYREHNPGLMAELFNKKVKNAFDVQDKIRKLYEECSKDEHFYPPFKILWNYMTGDRSLLSLYRSAQIDFGKAKNDIVEFCSFVTQMDNCEYGHFYLSTYAGQSWHHDENLWEDRLRVLKVYEKIIRDKMDGNKADED